MASVKTTQQDPHSRRRAASRFMLNGTQQFNMLRILPPALERSNQTPQ